MHNFKAKMKISKSNIGKNKFITKKHNKINKGKTDHKCESCTKSFSHAFNLKKHIYTIHEDHKDHKCESCGKLFSQAGHLKTHIHTIHDNTNVTNTTKHNRRH